MGACVPAGFHACVLYIPVGLLEVIPQLMQWRPPAYRGRNELETLLASESAADWVRISEMLLGPAPPGFTFAPYAARLHICAHKDRTRARTVFGPPVAFYLPRPPKCHPPFPWLTAAHHKSNAYAVGADAVAQMAGAAAGTEAAANEADDIRDDEQDNG
ncbi:hypothetical protein OEZ85_000033 [Tetradesmus obliquus]|uniref:Uncharacterized protein n=1 Tax=Tetradesmus obliquus TaxID=3088 RepID=A0ABY8UNW9_TETOB|nr:hypothetical protein OEZ85_000033 [Tetradesmus obliquus]